MESGSDLPLSTTVFGILRDLIHERVGIYYDDEKRDLLAEKLSSLVVDRGFGTFLDYYYLLKYGPDAELEWRHVVNALSVQETYFWREMAQIRAFVDQLVPQYVRDFPTKSLNIWCAACATGEEPLTIAMALNEAGWFDRLPIKIFASDASSTALAKARGGIYRDRSFRALPSELKEKYFTADVAGRCVAWDLHKRVSFAQANLLSPADIAPFVTSPVIFCRNVFIYFSAHTIGQTVRRFAQSMERPGYLFVGISESLLKVTDEFELREAGDAFVYVLR
jgi:chemotaxis protein methyltransferase CheR